MSNYNNFSHFYDVLTFDVNYKKRAKYIISLFKKFHKEPTLLLDLACGTGGFSAEFAKSGIDVIGVDKSEGMLSIAQEKNLRLKKKVLYLCQSAEELDLYGTVDGAVCCLDSINHITESEALSEVFKKVALFLEPECLFIFDVNTLYKHKEILGNNSYKMRKKGINCSWINKYNDEDKTVEIELEFSFKTSLFKRGYSTEKIIEKAYDDEELKELLNKAGFEVLAVYGEMTEIPPKPDSQRNIYVCKKRKIDNGKTN